MATENSASALVRAALYWCPGRVRHSELQQLLPESPEARLAARQEIDRLEIAGDVERLVIGNQIMYRVCGNVEPPENVTEFARCAIDAGEPWTGWRRRAGERDDRYGGTDCA